MDSKVILFFSSEKLSSFHQKTLYHSFLCFCCLPIFISVYLCFSFCLLLTLLKFMNGLLELRKLNFILLAQGVQLLEVIQFDFHSP